MSMNCPECEKKDKRIAELERLLANMSETYDAMREFDDVRNADYVDFVQEVGN